MSITGSGSDAPICTGAAYQQQSTYFYPKLRVLLRSKANGMYVTTRTSATPLTASVDEADISYTEVFSFNPMPGGGYQQSIILIVPYVFDYIDTLCKLKST